MASRRPRQPHGHPGPSTDHPATARPPRHRHRQSLGQPATAAHRLRAPHREAKGPRFNAALAAEDPTNEIAAAHAVKERLRLLLAEHQPHQIRRRLYEFYDAAARADMEETSRLATTIDTWRPAVLVALTEDVTNARTEGFNRIIKQTKRVGCGSTNMDNYRRRIMVHIALTRGQRPAA
ncbi:transposase [Janibacter sp. YB324]|nr:transposase [Janibacter sp. YB324]QNF95485.1 transposase [Janibacter sp. YB324]